MMGSSTHETSDDQKDRDDLTQIRGIGVVRKRWLNSLGIATIADLAQASANAVEARAKSDGRTLSHDELEEWIAQAQLYHVQASLEQAEPSPADAIAAANHSEPLVSPRAEREPDLADWASIASFTVDYQARLVNGLAEQRLIAHHLETNVTESWADFETDLMPQWLRDRVEAMRPPLQPGPANVVAPVVADITQLRMMQLHHMSLPMVANKNSPIFSDAIYKTEPFALEVSMQLTGLTEADQEKPVASRVQCLARHLATGETDSLGDMTAQIAPAKGSIHHVLMPSLRLLQPGLYSLKILVTLQHEPTALGHFKVPMLQVV